MPPIVTEAICLTVQKFSETSKIAVLYTRAWGRISVIAKGANRPKSQFLGHLEPLSVAECVIYKKSREQLHLLASCRATVPWIGLTDSLTRAGYAFAVGEFLYRHTYEEADERMYSLARHTLETMSRLPETHLGRQYWGFLLTALGHMGFRPNYNFCDSCHRSPEAGQKVVFDAIAGKIVCRACRQGRPEAGRPHILSAEALAELLSRQIEPILTGSEPELGRAPLDEIARAVEDFARYHLGGGRTRSLDLARRTENG
jgi:DNA repair protein RecO (recombination protein O)